MKTLNPVYIYICIDISIILCYTRLIYNIYIYMHIYMYIYIYRRICVGRPWNQNNGSFAVSRLYHVDFW